MDDALAHGSRLEIPVRRCLFETACSIKTKAIPTAMRVLGSMRRIDSDLSSGKRHLFTPSTPRVDRDHRLNADVPVPGEEHSRHRR